MRSNSRVARPSFLSPAETHEGGKAGAIYPKEQLLRTAASTMLFEDTFYESGDVIAARLVELVKANRPDEVARVARLCRNELKLRHVPLWLAVQAVTYHKGSPVTAPAIADIIQRPDELAEIISLYFKAAGIDRKVKGHSRIPAALKRGVAQAFTKFNEYQLAKWDRQDREVKIKDALFLTHPKPLNSEQDALWKRLITGTLTTPDTWEVAYSAAKTAEEKRAIWIRLISERKLGAMAMLMNLRNMTEVGVDPSVVVAGLQNIDARSRLLPFRFVAAARFAPQFAGELSDAMLRSVSGIKKLDGTTVLIIDNSGSMYGTPISAKSKLDRADAAGALAVLLREASQYARVFVYSDNMAEVANDRGLPLVDRIKTAVPAGGTQTARALAVAKQVVPNATRVILVTDEQAHDGIIPNWGTKQGYLVNVAPYAPGLDTSGGWERINGFSERLVDWISLEETGSILSSEEE